MQQNLTMAPISREMIAESMSSHSLCLVLSVALITQSISAYVSAGCFNCWRIFWCWGKSIIYSDFALKWHTLAAKGMM